MKIAFIGCRDIHKIGGIESYMYNLCTELVKLGHEPLVFCENDHEDIEFINGFKVVNILCKSGGFFTKPKVGLKAIRKCLKEYPDYKIYHFNAFGSGMFGFWARLHNRKTLIQLHGIESRRTKWSSTQRHLIEILEPLVVKISARYCTSVSQEQCDLINQHFPNKNCRYIPTAVHLPDKNCSTTNILDRFGISKNKFFLYLGRLVQDKNPDYLIKAFNASGINDYKLVIAGNNPTQPNYVEDLQNLAKDNPNIVFTDAVYGNDKETLLKQCFAFCIPSTIEGLAISLLEAMSYGKPVIASDIPANKEGLGERALWVKAEDVETLTKALKFSIENLEEMHELGLINRQRVENNFTWQNVVQQYINFVNKISKDK